MKRLALLLACAATLTAAQTPSTTTPSTTTPAPVKKPSTAAAKPAAKASTAATAKSGTGTAAKSTTAAAVKFPPGVKPSLKVMKTAFALKYQDIEVGTGPVAEPLKLYKVKYTGWLAADGKKFDSSEDHPGKEPIQFPQGRGRVIPGWDQGFEGMKIGGKRRIFIPWQLAYGAAGRPPMIPAKSDLVFDVELVDVSDMPQQAPRPMPQRPAAPGAPGTPGANPASPANPAATPQPGAPQSTPQPSAPQTTPQPATPPTAPQATPAPGTTTPPPADKPTQPQQ